MDGWLVFITILLSVFLFLLNIYLLIRYCHPEDRSFGASWFCKILVVIIILYCQILGLTLSWAQILMLPLDVSNSRGDGGGLDMEAFWQVIYMMIAILVIILLPYAIFFYESDEEKKLVKS